MPALALPSEPVGPPNAMPLPTLVAAGPASVAGAWEAPFEGQIPAVHVALLPDQRVLYWSGDVAGERDQIYFLSTVYGGEVRVLAPPYDAASVSTIATPGGSDLFCSGHTLLPDGRLLSAGGSSWHPVVTEPGQSFVDGTSEARIFDWRTDSWTYASDMNVPRWYPTVMTTSEGGLAASGIHQLVNPATHQASMEQYDSSADAWNVVPGGSNVLPLYPRLFDVPSGPLKGQLYYETGGTLWGPFGERPEEPLWNLAQAYDPATDAWRILGPSVLGARQSPNNVMLPLDPADGYAARILTFAGTLQRSVVATNTAELTDLSVDPPTHALAAPLHTPRWQSSGILLPDGKVLAVGGGIYDNVMTYGSPDPAVMTAELYDPTSGSWTEQAPMTIPREYHGTALLLPDARVLVGGHVPNPVPWTALRDNVNMAAQDPHTKFEIFEPPYLHWGVAQPTITSAPSSIAYGQTFTVDSADAASITDAILVRHMAETHSSDPGQRAIVLPVVSQSGATLTFEAPADAQLATPGPWMLFLRTSSEHGLVPGVAKTVMLG
ncbi:MAG TPA: galactose oxidase-like domain-containing protein [Candidatus Thermoplasmatota archaeon]|nr:galactose oxidase-like domain-containing protein [Candidatus Thermoplasmatota archaeon]